MKELKIIITSLEKLGWANCCFIDRNSELHYFTEQIPMVTENLFPEKFPFIGYLTCNVLKVEANIATIDISPLCIDQNGNSIFEVYLSQLQ